MWAPVGAPCIGCENMPKVSFTSMGQGVKQMIDEKRTFTMFGYYSGNLKPHSRKKVVACCNVCNKERIIRYGKYRDLCHACACKLPEFSAKISMSNARRICSDITRAKISASNKGRQTSQETRAKLAIASTGRKPTMETRAKISFALMGEKNNNYGLNFSVEHRAKISAANIGKKHTQETRYKMSIKASGKNSSRWKGGITPLMHRIRDSKTFKNWRQAVFSRDCYTCMLCGDSSGGNLQAHHIEPMKFHHNDLLMYDVNNGITLCKTCHTSVYYKEEMFADTFKELIA